MRRLTLLFALVAASSLQAKCVQIFYDRAPKSAKPYAFGRVHALFLQNLLGHFPNIQQKVIPIEAYREGMLEDCAASLYLGTYFFDVEQTPGGTPSHRIPRAFFSDYLATKKNVAWLGYNIWQLGPAALEKLWKVKFEKLSTLDFGLPDAQDRPGYYKFYEYRGETFFKFGDWTTAEKKEFLAAFEIAQFSLTDPKATSVLSWAIHSGTFERTPYILRDRNHFYVGDSPFSFMTEEDRYLIFADLLFDIVDEKPRHPGKKPAFLRLEDVHPIVPTWQIDTMAEMLERQRVPFAISLIPVFADPREVLAATVAERFVPLTQSREFVASLESARKRGASFLLHGFTHQYGKQANPFNGLSGDDFEFWDRVNNRPIKEDSPQFVLRRLESALKLIGDANVAYGTSVNVQGWLTPHYQASILDNLMFGKLFAWTVGRDIYFPYTVRGKRDFPDALRLEGGALAHPGAREPYFRNLMVEYDGESLPNGQLFPYEIFGDVNGARKIPENVGNVQPYKNEQVHRTQSIEELIANLKRNRVLRDTWGSFFVHPFRLNERFDDGVGEFPGDTRELERLVQAARGYGYEFIDLQTWGPRNAKAIRPEPIEIHLGENS